MQATIYQTLKKDEIIYLLEPSSNKFLFLNWEEEVLTLAIKIIIQPNSFSVQALDSKDLHSNPASTTYKLPWASHLTLSSLSFLIYPMRIPTTSRQDVWKTGWTCVWHSGWQSWNSLHRSCSHKNYWDCYHYYFLTTYLTKKVAQNILEDKHNRILLKQLSRLSLTCPWGSTSEHKHLLKRKTQTPLLLDQVTKPAPNT